MENHSILTMSFFSVVCGCSLIVDGKMSAAVVPMVLNEMKLTPKMMMLFFDSFVGPALQIGLRKLSMLYNFCLFIISLARNKILQDKWLDSSIFSFFLLSHNSSSEIYLLLLLFLLLVTIFYFVVRLFLCLCIGYTCMLLLLEQLQLTIVSLFVRQECLPRQLDIIRLYI